jgi:hypothetical protein
MKVKTYYCDICGKVTPENEVRGVSIKFTPDSNSNYKRLDFCEGCYDEATKNTPYAKVADTKEKFIDIFKLWIFRKNK